MAAKKKTTKKRSKKTAQKKGAKKRESTKAGTLPRELFVRVNPANGLPVGTPHLTMREAKNLALPGDEIGTYALMERKRTN